VCPLNNAADTSANVDWYGTFRGRAGWTAGKVLFYGTGGLAYGRVELDSNFYSAGLSLNSQTSSIRAGWVAGAGIEYMLLPNVVLNLGYQYVDLGTADVASSTSSLSGVVIGQAASAHAAFSVVTVGLNWRFSPTAAHGSTSMPWEGPYVGGHGGGAWGLSTDAIYTGLLVGP
jgi:outer membrane immunogenic protein